MEKLLLEDFTKYKFLSNITYSPKGDKVAFTLHRMYLEENKYLSNIYVYDLKGKDSMKLTSNNSENSFIFKDNDTLFFPTIRDEKDKKRRKKKEKILPPFYEISLKGGEANKVFEIPP